MGDRQYEYSIGVLNINRCHEYINRCREYIICIQILTYSVFHEFFCYLRSVSCDLYPWLSLHSTCSGISIYYINKFLKISLMKKFHILVIEGRFLIKINK